MPGLRPPVPLPPTARPQDAVAYSETQAEGPLCERAGPDCPAIGHRAGEKERLIDAMEKSGWVQAKAARILGLTPRQIGYALKKHRVELKRF